MLQVLGALVQLDIAGDIWEEVFEEALAVLPLASDDALAAAASFLLKAAAECQQLPQAVSQAQERVPQIKNAAMLGVGHDVGLPVKC